MTTSEVASTYNDAPSEGCSESVIREDLLCALSSLRTLIFIEQLQVKRCQAIKRYRLAQDDAYWGQQAILFTSVDDRLMSTIVETLLEQRPQKNRGISAARRALADQQSGVISPALGTEPDGRGLPPESSQSFPLPSQTEQ